MSFMDIPMKDALYYPYIHFRDETWLRSALLFFPHVLRMAPLEYAFRDSPFVRELMRTRGAWDQPLVGTYPLDDMEAYKATNRLARRLEKDLDDESFVQRFDLRATVDRYGDDGPFQIHRAKFSYNLERVLEEKKLIWHSRARHHQPGAWYSVHPRIGEVIMSTAASAASRARGCDIVTDSVRDHVLSAHLSEDELYDSLLHEPPAAEPPRMVSAMEVGDLVISMTFDLSDMTADDFAALSKDQETLYEFSKLLSEEASKIPLIGDSQQRLARAQHAADQIVDMWETRRRSWGPYLKGLFKLESLDEAKDMATESLKFAFHGGAAGVTLTGTLLGAVPGLAVGMILHGAKTWKDAGARERESPTYFLSKIAKHGGIVSAARALR